MVVVVVVVVLVVVVVVVVVLVVVVVVAVVMEVNVISNTCLLLGMSPPFKSFLKGLLEKNKDKRQAAHTASPALCLNYDPRLDWPALADHPFIADCDVLAPVVYMQGAVEYSQLPRCASTPAAAADACSKPMSAAASSSRSHAASAKQHANAQQQQYLRVGSPAEGSFVDAMQFEGGSASAVEKTSLPLSDMVISGDDDGNDDGGGGDAAYVVAVTTNNDMHQVSRLALNESSMGRGEQSSIEKLATR